MTVVTRFAPSPTGYLHIGGARTALFNWLYARHTGGRFLLRIEDTDRERSTEAAVQAIFDGLNWLGLAPDETPVFQHARADRHREAVDQLLAGGRAYRDWLTPQELEALRERRRDEGRPFVSPLARPGPGRGDRRTSPTPSASSGRWTARPWSKTWCRATCGSQTRTSTTWCCCARTARQPTTSPWWWTTTTWASLT
jgi:glutamyl-tRNA synthetase